MLTTNKLYLELLQDYPTKDDLMWWYKKDVERGAEGETVLGFLLDYCKDVYCMPKPNSYRACLKLMNKLLIK